MSLYKGSTTETIHDAAYLAWEMSVDMSRDVITVPANTPAMVAGTVVAIVARAFVAFDGTQTDLGILMYATELDAANAQEVVVSRYYTVANEDYLDWGGATQPQIDAAKVVLWDTNKIKVKAVGGQTVAPITT